MAVMVDSRGVPNVEKPKVAGYSIEPQVMMVDSLVVPAVVPLELEEPGPSVVSAAVAVEDPLAIPFAALFEVEVGASLMQETNSAVRMSVVEGCALLTKEVVESLIRVEEA